MTDAPMPNGYYWIRCAEGSPEIAHHVGGEWWLTGAELPLTSGVEVLSERPIPIPKLDVPEPASE